MKNPYDIIVRPLITEKTTKLVDTGKYTFEVMQDANKIEVKRAVEDIFKVNVVDVNIINVRKKPRKVGRYEGFAPAVRKAVVTLQKGQTIDRFEI
ncbi:MAG: 50S ribosomal protein L23 [Bacilli bacterium]|nr:50S ribosomal protein L23 [Bacilli bacterium]MDD4076454.1 50S ribosomal protein L23 [Bacilli bacterium]MDD4387983.1 50S ribosomal protein L23 [Bacilli bacterium]